MWHQLTTIAFTCCWTKQVDQGVLHLHMWPIRIIVNHLNLLDIISNGAVCCTTNLTVCSQHMWQAITVVSYHSWYCSNFFCQRQLSCKLSNSCKMSTQLSSASSWTIYHLSCHLTAQTRSVSSVCLLSCITSAQLQYISSAAVCQLSSAAIWRLGCNLSNKLPGQLQLVSSDELAISAATCWLSCTLCPQRVGSAVLCVLSCKRELKSTTENLKVVICPWWRRKGLIRVAWHIFVQAGCQVWVCHLVYY